PLSVSAPSLAGGTRAGIRGRRGVAGRRGHGPGDLVEGADARVLPAGTPDQPERQGRQGRDGDEDDVVAGEDGGRRTGRAEDAAPGQQGEDLVDGLDRLRAADRAPRRGAAGDEQVVDRRRGGRGERGDLLVGRILDGHHGLARQAVRGGDGERPLVVG